MGHEVICVDIAREKIERLNRGEIPIYEPGLDQLVARGVKEKRLFFSLEVDRAVQKAQAVFIAVGTPPGEDGTADLQYVIQVAETIGKSITEYKVVVTKSTVPVGT